MTINHTRSVSLKYGVSVNRGERTSGIKWADCVFQNGGKNRNKGICWLIHYKEHIIIDYFKKINFKKINYKWHSR